MNINIFGTGFFLMYKEEDSEEFSEMNNETVKTMDYDTMDDYEQVKGTREENEKSVLSGRSC